MSTALRSIPSLRSLGTAATLVACFAVAPDLEAQDYRHDQSWRRERAADGRLVSVEVRVDGHWAPLYGSGRSDERLYFQAERRKNYELRIRNLSGRRIGVLISVDGLNVVNGLRSSLSNNEPMYVLDPWERTTIRGWRTSLQDVRRFVFVDEEKSYAERTGQGNGDMGWIRVLAFEEERRYVRPWDGWYHDWDELAKRERDTKAKKQDSHAPSPEKGSADQNAQKGAPPTIERQDESRVTEESFPGTGWGDRRRDPVQRTTFDPVYVAADHLILRYEYASGLADLGIPLDWARLERRERGEPGFARAPGW
jgi:hypothetical protein